MQGSRIDHPPPASFLPGFREHMPGGLSCLPRSLHVPELAPALEHAIVELAALRSRIGSRPFLSAVPLLAQRADILLSDTLNCNEDDLIGLLGALDGPPPPSLLASVNRIAALDLACNLAAADPSSAYSPNAVRQLHTVLTANLAIRGQRGEFRRAAAAPNMPTPSFWPLPRRLTPDPTPYMQDLEQFLVESPFMPLVQRLALVCGQLEAVEPFAYGSSAITNVLVQTMLGAAGYPSIPIASVIAQDRRAYESGIALLGNGGSWTGWISQFLGYLGAGIRRLSVLLDRLEALRVEWTSTLGSLRSDAAALSVADRLVTEPVVTVARMQHLCGLSYQRANAAFATLVERQLIAPITSERLVRRNRLFVAGDVTRTLVDVIQDTRWMAPPLGVQVDP